MSTTENHEHHDHESLPAEVIQSEKIWWAILPVLLSAVIGGVILFSVMTAAPASEKTDSHSTKQKDKGEAHSTKPAHSEPQVGAAGTKVAAKMGNFRIFHATNSIEISGKGPKAPVYDALLTSAKANFPDKPQLASWIEEEQLAIPFGDQIPALTALFTQPETGIEFDGLKFHVTWPEGDSRDALYEKLVSILGEEHPIQWATAPIRN